MSVAQQTATRNLLDALMRQPLQTLQNNPLSAGGFGGNDTYVEDGLSFAFNPPMASIGPAHFADPIGISQSVIHQVHAYVTPMRAAAVSPARLAATARFGAAAGPSLWVTTRQTGCSVIVLDWGGSFSMVHLQPFTPNNFNRVAQSLMSVSNYALREVRRYSLQSEFSSIIQASNGAAPQRYILVQSNWAANYLGVTGVRTGGLWTFYLQEYDFNGVVNLTPLQWTQWHRWGTFVASAF